MTLGGERLEEAQGLKKEVIRANGGTVTMSIERGFGGLARVLLPSERLQVRERMKGERLPLFLIKISEENEKISRMWRIPGTLVRISTKGDIHYPVWVERSRISDPENYVSCSKLPRGWTLTRLLGSQRRPISVIVFHQVKKDDGAVETAIRAMDHVLEKFQNKGKELEQVDQIDAQITQVIRVLQETEAVPREEFERGFEILYRQTLELLEKSGMGRSVLALKKDIERLLAQASTGTDRLGRRNPMAMMKKLEAAAKRVSYRRNETGFIVAKFEAMKAGLLVQREKDREILSQARHELSIGFASHEVFKYPGRPISRTQKGILSGMIGTLIYRFDLTKVKCYRSVASEAIEELKKAREMVKEENFAAASAIFRRVLEETSQISDRFQEIYPSRE